MVFNLSKPNCPFHSLVNTQGAKIDALSTSALATDVNSTVQYLPGNKSCQDCCTAGVVADSALTGPGKPGDRMTGRYYQDPSLSSKASAQSKAEAKAPSADAEQEREQLLAAFEKKVADQPDNEELWVLYALQHVDFGAVQSLKGTHMTNCTL